MVIPRRVIVLLLAPIALIALWIRSAYVGDLWTWTAGPSEYRLRSDWGRLSMTVVTGPGVRPADPVWYAFPGGGYAGEWPGPASTAQDCLVGQYRAGTLVLSTTDTFRGVEVYHPVVIALSLLPAAPLVLRTLARRRRRGRAAAGLCPDCGYDVRATSGRCPECGARVPNATVGT